MLDHKRLSRAHSAAMTRVLVTGATGFIGRQLAESLLRAGYDVACLARAANRAEPLQTLGARIIEGDVTRPESLPAALAGIEVVYHLAGLTRARSRREFFAVNETGTANLLDACRNVDTPPSVVLVSSQAAAGPAIPGRPRVEEDPPAPVSIYGRSKWAGELAAIARARHLPITIVRPSIVLGEGDRVGLEMFRMTRRMGLHIVPGWRPPRLSIVYVADLVDAIMAVAARGQRLPADSQNGSPSNSRDSKADPRGIYFIAGPEEPTFAELGRMVGASVGRRRTRVIRVPSPLVWPIVSCAELISFVRRRAPLVCRDKAREALAADWTCSSARAVAELGFKPAIGLRQRLRANGGMVSPRRLALAASWVR